MCTNPGETRGRGGGAELVTFTTSSNPDPAHPQPPLSRLCPPRSVTHRVRVSLNTTAEFILFIYLFLHALIKVTVLCVTNAACTDSRRALVFWKSSMFWCARVAQMRVRRTLRLVHRRCSACGSSGLPSFLPLSLSALCVCEVSEAAFDISTGWEMTAECF